MLFIAVNEVNSTNSQILRYFGKEVFSRKYSHFQGVSSALEMAFQIQAPFKEFKDLHEP